MRVFVAGASGAIGRTLIPALVRAGHQVTGMTRSEAKRPLLEAMRAEAVIADALDSEAVTRVVSHVRPDVVIHELTALQDFSSMKNFDKTFELTNRLRTSGTSNLLKASIEAGVKRIVVQSFGGWVYERNGERLKAETDLLDPEPPRDARKSLEAIRTLEQMTLNTPGIEGVALRYGYFYGPETSLSRESRMIRDIRKGRIPIVGGGGGVWSFCHIEDAGTLTALAVDHGRPGIYNVADDEPAEVSVWLPELARAVGGPSPKRFPAWLARLALGPNAVSMMTRIHGISNMKAKQEFGWQPVWKSWREGFLNGLG